MIMDSDGHIDDRDSDEMERQAPRKEKSHGLLWLIIIVFVVWFFFFRIDYSKPWIKEGEEEDALVVWCKNGDCNNTEHRYTLLVQNEGRAAYGDDRYILDIFMPNDGEVEINAFCSKAADGLVYDRYCQGVDESGEIWLVAHLKN